MHLAGMAFTFFCGLFCPKMTPEEMLTTEQELSTHFQIAARFSNWRANVTQSTMFDYGLTQKAEVGYPGVEHTFLLDDYIGPIVNGHPYTWISGADIDVFLGNATAFVPSNSSSFVRLDYKFDSLQELFGLQNAEALLLANGGVIANETLVATAESVSIVNVLGKDLLKVTAGETAASAAWTALEHFTANQTFAVVNKFLEGNGEQFSEMNVDGAINLGFSNTKATNAFAESVLEKLKEKVITYWIEPAKFPQFAPWVPRQAVFTFGSKDPEHCHSEGWWVTPQLAGSPNGWKFNIDYLNVNGLVIDREQEKHLLPNWNGNGTRPFAKPATAVLAKTSYYVQGPQQHIEFIVRQVGAENNMLYPNRFVVRCEKVNKELNITFGVGDNQITLTPDDYFVKDPVDENFCVLIFTEFQLKADRIESADWILGAPFLNRRCASLDVTDRKIGFTMAK